MLIECQNCGGPLSADGSQMFVDCRYCGRSNKVASAKTLMQQTPAGWQPPAQWSPEQTFSPAQEHALTGAAASVGASMVSNLAATGCIALVVVLVTAGAVGFAFWQGGAPASSTSGASPFGPTWDGSAPFECSGNDRVRIEDVTANLPGQSAVTARLNCEVTIVNSTLTAATGVDASGNGTVRLENTTIRASQAGVRLGINKRAVLVDSTVVSSGVGVEASMNAEVELRGSRVEGAPAVQLRMNATLDEGDSAVVDR